MDGAERYGSEKRSAPEMITRRSIILLALLATGCGGIPRDPDGTSERVRAERQFKVGLIEGHPFASERQLAFVQQVAKATGARPVVERGAAEPLLARLEHDALDLVVGTMAPESPWQKQVHFLEPLAEHVDEKGHLHLIGVARNGENKWITLLTREARKVAGR